MSRHVPFSFYYHFFSRAPQKENKEPKVEVEKPETFRSFSSSPSEKDPSRLWRNSLHKERVLAETP